MKLVSYKLSDNNSHLGAVVDDQIINLHRASAG